MLLEADLPDDIDALRALVLEQARTLAGLTDAKSKAERPEAHLHGFTGILQVDGNRAYAALAGRHQQIRLAFC